MNHIHGSTCKFFVIKVMANVRLNSVFSSFLVSRDDFLNMCGVVVLDEFNDVSTVRRD